jgi:hypothetical protein
LSLFCFAETIAGRIFLPRWQGLVGPVPMAHFAAERQNYAPAFLACEIDLAPDRSKTIPDWD